MRTFTNYPLLVFVSSFVAMWLSTWIGAKIVRKWRKLEDDAREDFDVVRGATLTLLGLIIGFSFSMAIGRYDQRKLYEEAEANAIGTEYIRADLLPPADAKQVRGLLSAYLDQRILFYMTRDEQALAQVGARTAQLQAGLWSAVVVPAAAQPTPVSALAVAGMNDVLNAQGYTQAAWWNRIPDSAWGLMVMFGVCGSVLLGYGAKNAQAGRMLRMVLPIVVSLAFFMIADIDSPRHGIIRVQPQNLTSLAESLRAQ